MTQPAAPTMDAIAMNSNTRGRGCKQVPDHNSIIIKPTRREALIAGGVAFGSLVGGPEFGRSAECVLTSRQVDGPYHIQDAEDRRDVRSGKLGVDLVLRMKVVDADACEAIAGVRTEIWSCDALGNYSGHPDVDPNVPPGFGGGGGRPGGRGERPGRRQGGPGAGAPGFGGGPGRGGGS